MKCEGTFFRDIPLGKETKKVIQDYLEKERDLDEKAFPDSDALFLPANSKVRRGASGWLTLRIINAIVKKFPENANADLNDNEKLKPEDLHPHAFRYTHAYKLLAKSDIAQVQKRLGHKRPDLVVLYAQVPEAEEALIDEVEQK
ncbi:site-specific integrase [bacterium]|nr:site-specific integrase [bacterium]